MGRPAGTFRHGANGAYGAAVRRLYLDDVLLNLEILCARPRVDETLLHPALTHIPIGRIISTASSMLSWINACLYENYFLLKINCGLRKYFTCHIEILTCCRPHAS